MFAPLAEPSRRGVTCRRRAATTNWSCSDSKLRLLMNDARCPELTSHRKRVYTFFLDRGPNWPKPLVNPD